MAVPWFNLKETLKDGLMALCTAADMTVFHTMLEEEVTALVGPKGKHRKEARTYYRHGSEKGGVVLDGRRVAVERPRVRGVEGQEAPLEVYEMARRGDPLVEAALAQMLHGLSSRNYAHGLEPGIAVKSATATSKSAVSRQFINGTEVKLKELLGRRFDDVEIPVLLIDGVQFAEHHVIIAMGITMEGRKKILGMRIGSTENQTVCKDLLCDLVERGVNAEEGLLAVIDGSKALHSALGKVFGEKVLIRDARCINSAMCWTTCLRKAACG